MIDWEEARDRIVALGRPVATVDVPIAEAIGRWLAEPISARRTQPPDNLSAMDGYAVRHAETRTSWRVVGEARAGHPFDGTVGEAEAVRISTGASLPRSTDTIIIQEAVEREGDILHLAPDQVLERGQWVRPRASDFAENDVVLKAGIYLNPAAIGLAVMAGHDTLPVHRRITVAILPTGDELAPYPTTHDATLIPDSNSPLLAAMLVGLPVEVRRFDPVPDTVGALAVAVDTARGADVIVTIGGASVGDHDMVRPVLRDAGAFIDFWKIAMRPGKPLLAGRLDNAIVLGLPGNPVSTFVTATLFLKPLIARLAGAADPLPPPVTARLGQALPEVGLRTDFVRMRWSGGRLCALNQHDSGRLLALHEAQVLAVRPPHSGPAAVGDEVGVIDLA